MIRRLLTATALVAGLALPAQAEDPAPEPAPAGTADEAAALRTAFAAYLTQMPFDMGLLRIEPDPAGQRLTIDPAPVLRDFVKGEAEAAPLSVLVSRRTDGDWNVFTRDPIDLRFETRIETETDETTATFAYSQGRQVFKGVYAPGLFAYRTAEGSARDTVSTQTDALSEARTTIGETRISMSARPGAGGGVDIDFGQTLTDYAQEVEVKAPPPSSEAEAPDEAGDAETQALVASLMSFTIKAGAVETVATVRDARNVEVMDLYALVLRHADALGTDGRAALAGPLGEELRAALLKILPVWTSFDVAATAREASFQSPFATLRAAEAKQSARLTGVAERAGLDADMSVKGLTVDGAVLPAWASRFLPKEAEFGLSITGLDLGTPADLAIRNVDFTADEPFSEDVKARILAAFDPAAITIALKPSVVRASDLELNLSGRMTFVGEKPAGTLTARATGLDRTIESLQRAAADEPDLHQVVGMVQLAQGLGRKTAEGDWEWVVDAAADGSVTVNGAMLKGPDPVEEPGSDVEPDTDAAPEMEPAPDRL